MRNIKIAQKMYQALLSARHVLLIPHQHPDGDALGSVTAMARFLESRNIRVSIFCATAVKQQLSFLHDSERVSSDPEIWNDPSIDVVVVFDSGDLVYAGVADHLKHMGHRPIILNIDHHATNEDFGDINLVLRNASSTAEIMYKFFVHNNVRIDKEMATSLLTGIITDTDNFTNSATTPSSIFAASQLMALGGDVHRINRVFVKDKTVPSLKIWGVILARLEHHDELDIVYTYITRDDYRQHKLTPEQVNLKPIINFLNNIDDGRAGLLLNELDEKVHKGSFRTTRNDTNVAKWAQHFGGGGHEKAAGFTIEGKNLDEALAHVFETIKKQEKAVR